MTAGGVADAAARVGSGYRCSPAHAAGLAAVVAALAAAAAFGAPLGAGPATAAACVLLLLAGLPHGALDIELLKRGRRDGAERVALLFFGYLLLAGATLLLWRAAPVAALLAFLAVAVLHFGEDWAELNYPPLARGAAAGLLCAPALAHRDELAAIFVALCGDPRAAAIAAVMLAAAPAGAAVVATAAWRLLALGRGPQAAATLAALAAMVLLPPVIGFAVFFCLHHSPRHLAQAWRDLAPAPAAARRLRWTAAGVTAAALGAAAALFALAPAADPAARALVAAFVTLSALTVPHMALPLMVARAGA